MEVVFGGVPVVEVAERYGVSGKTVHPWLRHYRQDGLAGLAERSHRPHQHPGQLAAAEIEAQVRAAPHSSRGARRLVHERRRLGVDLLPSRSTVYRVLVRHSLVTAVPAHVAGRTTGGGSGPGRCSCGNWQLWQLDVMGSVLIEDPSAPAGVVEVKLISGIDDHPATR